MTEPSAPHTLIRRPANVVIHLATQGSGPLRIDTFPRASGRPDPGVSRLAGTEAVGGVLTVTTDGLRFRAHPVNFVRGQLDVPIARIADARDASSGLTRLLAVTLETGQRLLFVVWGGQKVIAALDEARALSGSAGASASDDPA
ncbi:hypothetical protein ACMT9U_10780 [Clavibacter sp. Sh2036]|uniref:hypothetical protein n=1 Tax=unclassified Clavibacter TaxID=2626594 RepID=UPI0022EA8FE2|nr:hypothetical protein [Clavibacter sp. CT19]MDA3805948.1 hypothetical protein [Clavibacter sp. CT19]